MPLHIKLNKFKNLHRLAPSAFFMKRKFKQRWSIISPISTKQTITFNAQSKQNKQQRWKIPRHMTMEIQIFATIIHSRISSLEATRKNIIRIINCQILILFNCFNNRHIVLKQTFLCKFHIIYYFLDIIRVYAYLI